MSNTNTFVDGCGVYPDTPIGEGLRIRFRIDKDRQQDISVYVEDGMLHVYGLNRPLIVTAIEPNRVDITTEKWHKEKT